MTLYSNSKRAYRKIGSPFSKFLFSKRTKFSRVIVGIKSRLESSASHDDVYDREYYLKYSGRVEKTAMVVAEWLVLHEDVESCIDVGCGSGEIIGQLAAKGISVSGYDLSDAALALCREKGLSVEKLDLEMAPTPSKTADLVISTEVAEHIPEEIADSYVDFLCGTAPIVYVTAATPGQGGTDHVNEKPNSYWIDKFAERGMSCDMDEVRRTRKGWRDNGADRIRSRNLLIFRKSPPTPLAKQYWRRGGKSHRNHP